MEVTRRLVVGGAGALMAGCALHRGDAVAHPITTPPITMPVDPQATTPPDLVDLARHDPRLRFDIRYATADNFMGRPLYPAGARTMAQRPVAEALSRAQTRAAAEGFGLLIHDAYRPWRVTKIMWDETPPEKREFVSDPAAGSRHNRGCAIDLTLHRGGVAVAMPSPYDDFTEKAYRSYSGGTAEETAHRGILERIMQAEGFDLLPNEWWHFDWQGWRAYPIMDAALD